MSEHDWQEIKRIFNEALALAPEQRQAFLDGLSSRAPELHREIVDLLKSHDDADENSFLGPLEIGKKTKADLAETVALSGLPTLDQGNSVDEVPSMCTLSSMVEIPETTYIGQLGDYQLIEQIGRGGMGVVYKAYHEKLRRTVALKVIASGSLCAPEDIARFHIEAEAAARLNHPGIVPVYDVGEHEGTHYYSMAYVEGDSLSSYVGTGKPRLEPRRAAELMELVCRAVQYAHDRAVIHRDLKPANILVDKEGQPKLTDFGLAKVLQEEEGLTMTGQVMGTPNYMAPEQAKGQQDRISNRTDVYSLGATLYALLAGSPPFKGKTLVETLRQVESASPEPLTHRGLAIPLDLWTICEKSLAKRPEDRYESAGALADDLQRYLSGFPISARAVGGWARAWRWCQRNRLVASLIAVVATTLVVASIVSTFLFLQERVALARADQNLNLLESALNDAFVSLSENDLSDEPGTQQVRRKLLTIAQKYYSELGKTAQVSNAKVANAAYLLGRVQASLSMDREAEQSFNQAIALQQRLLATTDDHVKALAALAYSYNELAKLNEKAWNIKLFDKSDSEALAHLEAWEANSQLCLEQRTKALHLLPHDRDFKRLQANAKMNLGLAYVEQGRRDSLSGGYQRAEKLLLEALRSFRQMAREAPDDGWIKKDLARGLGAVARLRDFQAESDSDRKEELLRKALQLRTKAAQTLAALPSEAVTSETQMLLAMCYQLCGESHYQLGMLEEADNDYKNNLLVMQQLLLSNPSVFRYREGVARAQMNLCQFSFGTRKNDGYEYISQFQKTLVDGLAIDPLNQQAADLLFEYTKSVADGLAAAELYPEALNQLNQAIQLLESVPRWIGDRTVIDKTVERLRDSIKQVQKLVREDPTA